MPIRDNMKAVSTLATILLIIISLIIGGLVSYMFTIAFYVEIPEETAVTVTGVYLERENARSFEINVLNPSYSPTDAMITRIAVGLENGTQLYNIVEADPSIENGIVVPIGESLNITCFKAQRDSANVSWGRLAGELAGQNITVNVFSPDSPASNMKASLPFVKLHIIDPIFIPRDSFSRFESTVLNNANSEINLTINGIIVAGVDLAADAVSPELPQPIANGSHIQFKFNGSWHGLIDTSITVYTEEGYVFTREIELPQVSTSIEEALFNEDFTHYFTVAVANSGESADYVNVTKVACTLENGTTIERDYSSVGVKPNSTHTFVFDWEWRKYRDKEINLTAYFLQDLETDTFTAATPPQVILKVLNKDEVFNLNDKEHFNITLQNHPSSLEAVNITEIVVKETGEVLKGAKVDPELPYGPVDPGQAAPFYCDFNWTQHVDGDLTLTVHGLDKTLMNYTSEFVFDLPMAELNITDVTHTTIGGTRYLNITVRNLNYSISNVTISEATMTLPDLPKLEWSYPKSQAIVKPGGTASLLCIFDWEEHLGEILTATVVTEEGVQTSWQGSDW